MVDTWSGLDPAEKNQIECPHLQRGGVRSLEVPPEYRKGGGSCLNFDVQNHIFLKITKYLFKIIPWRSLQPQAVEVSPATGPGKEKYQREIPFGACKKNAQFNVSRSGHNFCLHGPKGIFLWPMAGETSTARVHGLWLERPPWDYFK